MKYLMQVGLIYKAKNRLCKEIQDYILSIDRTCFDDFYLEVVKRKISKQIDEIHDTYAKSKPIEFSWYKSGKNDWNIFLTGVCSFALVFISNEKSYRSNQLRLPVEEAKNILNKYDLSQVIICTWSNISMSNNIISYGNTIHDDEMAANGSNFIKKALGWPEENCGLVSEKVQKMLAKIEEGCLAATVYRDLYHPPGHGLDRIIDLLQESIAIGDPK